MQGGPFTWRGGRNNCSMSRIDRFLVSNDWESYFSGVTQSTLPGPISNHCPILLDAGGIRKGPILSGLKSCGSGLRVSKSY